jgi:integrase
MDLGFDPITGKRKRPMRTYPTRKDAERGRAEWLTEIENGTAVDPSKVTVAEYLQHWLTTAVKPRVRPSTYAGYERLIRVQITPRIGDILLQKLTALQIQDCYTRMRNEPRADKRNGTLSPRSVRYAHTVLKQALKQAVRWHLLARNAAADVDPPKAVRPRVEAWNAQEAKAFLAAIKDSAYAPFGLLALATGMRLGELRGLRWCDVDLAKGVLHVHQQITRVGRKDKTSEPKTNAGRRSITLPQDAIAALKALHAARPQQPIPFDPTQRDTDLVFAREDGKPVDQDAITSWFTRTVKRTTLKRITFHGLRHTHATLLLLAGVNVKAVSARLGHSSIQITLDTYAHLLPEMEQHAADAIGEALAATS